VASLDTNFSAHKTANNTHLQNIYSRQDDILTSTNAVKTNTQSLEDCVASNKVNVNISSGLGDLATESTLQIISEFNCDTTDVTVTSSALPSGAATDNSILSMRVREDEATTNGQYLMGTSAVVRQDTLASLVGTSGDNTQMSVDANGALYCINSATDALLTTIDEDTNAIKTSVQLLDNAVDGNYLNVNANIAGTDVDSNSGNKSAATQRVVIATDDIPIALVNTKLDHLSDNLDVLETTANAIQSAVEGTLTVGSHAVTNTGTFVVQSAATLQAGSAAIGKLAANSGVDIGDVDVTSISAGSNRIGMVGLKANEAADGSGTERHVLCDAAGHLQVDVLSAPSTAVTNAGLTSLAAAVNSDRVDVNIAAGGFDGAVTNAGLTALNGTIGLNKVNINLSSDAVGLSTSALQGTLNTKIDTIDSQIDLLEATNTIKDVEWLSSATISDQALSDVLDTEGYQNVFIYGENGGSISANSLKIFGSNESAGTYYSVGQMAVVTSDSGRYLIREDTPVADMPSPRYLKVFNNTGSTQTITKLRAVMSHKLRYL
jgi:hypothetical protein